MQIDITIPLCNKVSKYRKELMGIAIIIIMICHSTLYIENNAVSHVYYAIRRFCKIGVDMFLFMSGMGLYFSFNNDSNIGRFYKKRVARIIPQYAIVCACWGIVAISLLQEKVIEFVWKYSLISFYVNGELAAWFVAAIILLYLIFPILFNLLRSGRKYIFGLGILIYAVSFCITYIFPAGTPMRLINEAFAVRIPTFLAGMVIGEMIESEQENAKSTNNIYIYIITGVICAVLWLVNTIIDVSCCRWIERVLFMPLTICTVIVFGNVIGNFHLKTRTALSFLGSITLEIYLIHEKVLNVYDTYIPKCTAGSLISNISAVIVAILLSKCLFNIVESLKRTKGEVSA